jgi:asparagine synthetase B (glutamine-hydrolysing)
MKTTFFTYYGPPNPTISAAANWLAEVDKKCVVAFAQTGLTGTEASMSGILKQTNSRLAMVAGWLPEGLPNFVQNGTKDALLLDFAQANGSYAGIAIDTTNHLCTVFTSPWLAIPIYWCHFGMGILVSNSTRKLVSILGEGWKFNMEWIASFWFVNPLGGALDEQVIDQRMHRLKPGHILDLMSEKIDFWWRKPNDIVKISDAEAADEYRRRLQRAVEICVEGVDDPVGVELSGGLDSSAIALLLKSIRSDCVALSQVHLEADAYERDCMLDVVERARIPQWITIPGDRFWIMKDWNSISPHLSEPDPQILWWGAENEMLSAARNVGTKVILTGFGGDELNDLSPFVIADNLKSFRFKALFHDLQIQRRPWRTFWNYGIRPWFSGGRSLGRTIQEQNKSLKPLVSKFISTSVKAGVRRRALPLCFPSSPARQHTLESIVMYPGWFWDEIGQPLNIIYRYPYYNRQVVDFMLSLPPGQRFSWKLMKPIHRLAFNDLPTSVLIGRKAELSCVIKRGLNLEASSIRTLMRTSMCAELGWLDGKRIQDYFEDVINGGCLNFDFACAVLATEVWLRTLDL